MKSTGRIYMYPVRETQSRRPSKSHQLKYHQSPLKALSTGEIWTLLEDTRAILQNALFLTTKEIGALMLKEVALEIELDNRILLDESLCEKYGHLYRDERLCTRDELKRDSLLHKRELAKAKKITKALVRKALKDKFRESEALRVSSLSPPRKSLCKVPNTQFNGLKKPPHIPNPNNRIRVDRSKIRK